MSFLDTQKFREMRDRMKVQSGVSARRFDRELLDASRNAAAAAPVADTLQPDDFVTQMLADQPQDGDEAGSDAEQEDH